MLNLIKRNPRYAMGMINPGDLVNSLFRDMYGDVETESRTRWLPSVDIIDNTDAFLLTAELPGVSKEDVKINLNNNILTIEGEKKGHTEVKNDDAYRNERYYGKFTRSFTLSSEIEAEEIKADFKDGILTVNMPKSEKVKPRQISIN